MDKIKNLCKYFPVFILVFFAFACTNKAKENTALLHNAAQKIHADSKADEALLLLKTVETGVLNQADYAYFVLVQVRAWDFAGVNITMSDTAVVKSLNYFIETNNTEKAALAYFTLGRVYDKQGNTTKALYNYQQADDWAAKINYSITNFNYSAIPYNIARQLSFEGQCEESLKYCDEVLTAIDNETGHYTDKLYALELKGVNYIQLKNANSALACYSEAQEIADKYNDKESKNRIAAGKIFVISTIEDDYGKAESECRQLLSITPASDSSLTGRLYIVLSDIYRKIERLDSSLYYIHQAKQLLVNADLYYKIPLYKRLYTVERAKGNTAAANEYEKQYKQLKDAQLKSKQAQTDEIKQETAQREAQLIQDKLLALENAWTVSQKQATKQNIMFLLFALCIVAICILFYKARSIKMDVLSIKELFDYGKETMVRQINQRRDLFALLDHIAFRLDISGQRMPLITKMEKMLPELAWNDKPPHMYYQYYKTFERFKSDFPMLKEMEYRILCLLCALDLTNEELADYLLLEYDDYDKTKASMIAKLEKEGQSLDKLIKDTRSKCKLRLQSINLNLN